MNVFLINLVQKYGKRFRVAKAQRFKVFYAGEGFSQRREGAEFCFIQMILANIVISTEEKSSQETPLLLWTIFVELLMEISRSSK